MKQSNSKKSKRLKLLRRAILGIVIGGVVGYAASYFAGMAGSQCTIICNETVAVPYFAAVGFLIAWR
jgi:xanthine/uracil permease